jgi:hypothetical protein
LFPLISRYSAIIATSIARYVDVAAERAPAVDSERYIDSVGSSVGQLIGKMARQGYASSLISNLYPHALPQVTSQSPHAATVRKIWSHTMLNHLMLSPDLSRLMSGTFQYMDQDLSKANLTNGRIQQLAKGLFAMYFASEPVEISNPVLQLFWKTGWLESRTSPSVGATRTLAALLVYAGGIQESQSFDQEGKQASSPPPNFCAILHSIQTGSLIFLNFKLVSSLSITKRAQDILLLVLRKLISMWGDRQFVRNTPYLKQIGMCVLKTVHM